jgi:ABC-type lipoprotein release transport system permease subunit
MSFAIWGVAMRLALASSAAAFFPSSRAARINPVETLQAD